MIGWLLLGYVAVLGPSTGEMVYDSFLRDGVRPCDFERLTPKSKTGQTHLAGSGSGFFITADGYLLTNHHVIKDATEAVVVCRDVAYRAEFASSNEKKDLALLKVNLFPRSTNGVAIVDRLPKVPFLPFESRMSVGQTVYVVGFPETEILGYEPKVTRGMINSMTGYKGCEDRFQIDALIAHGNSGGPVVNECGAVLGVVSSGTDKMIGNYNFAINGAIVKSFLPQNIGTETATSSRKLDAAKVAQKVIEATVLVLVYHEGSCGRIESIEADANDVRRREAETQLKKAVLNARLCKLRREWKELKELTDWIIRNHGEIDDMKELNDLARDELGLHLRITAEADGRDAPATVRPLRGFRDDHVVCGIPAALYGGESRRGFPVEAKLEYEDTEWMWSGELKCPYDWTGTKDVRVVLKHVGKKQSQKKEERK